MTGEAPKRVLTYRDAGVDLDAAGELTDRLAAVVEATRTAGVASGFGSFGGRFRLPADSELVASADGVGTKVLVAARAGVHGTVGEDLVNHCVNDILAEGAEPLFFLDYFACGRLDPDVAVAVVEGVARGCVRNGCALLGGETAEMPDVYGPGEYDLAGFIVGRRRFPLPGRDGVEAGDVLVGLPSSGLHTNGYSLARRIFADRLGLALDDSCPGLGEETVARALLRVHLSYLDVLRPGLEAGRIRALAHITGGGIPGNLARVLPPHLDAVVRLDAWETPPLFALLAEAAGLNDAELYRTWNMGLGMVAIVGAGEAEALLAGSELAGTGAVACGHVEPGEGRVRLERGG
ncbi:MAG: phosphoribosylformylglycinamidine cyclo-ligase [Gemmatimonadota bacterium]|nr:phosphoribosylformylglycinamidine cyclo-ligase [Gemmatimonadota bacterium]